MDIDNQNAPTAGDATQAHVEAVQPDVLEAVEKVNARRVKSERKPKPRKAMDMAVPTDAEININEAARAAEAKEPTMNYDPANWMNNFASVPGADKLQTLFADAGERGQQVAERSQKIAGEMVELTRGNIEALVETGKIAAAGAQTLGQEAVARTRESLEQTVQQVRSLTQAGSPTEFFQLQGEIARTQFDRMVADGSRYAESMVKLAGEAFQPISTRAALNVEKLNDLTA